MISKELLRGLRHNSVGPLVFGLSLFLVFHVLCYGILSNALYSHTTLEQNIYRSDDDFTRVPFIIWESFAKRDHQNIYLLGASGLREGIQSQELANQQVKTLYPEFSGTLFKLATSGQTLAETLKIIDALPSQSGVIVVGMNPVRMSHPPEEFLREHKKRTLLPYSTALANYLNFEIPLLKRLPGMIVANHFWSWWSERKPFKNGIHSIPYNDHAYDHKPDLTEQEIAGLKKRLEVETHLNFKANFDFNKAALQKIFELATSKGLGVVLLEFPMNPIAKEQSEEVLQEYNAFLHEFSEKNKIIYLDFVWSLGLGKEYYYDFTHLRPAGRLIYQDKLLNSLARWFKP